MKTGIYLGKENIEIKEVEMPKVGDNDVLIKNIYSSICGTDVAVYKQGLGTGHKIEIGKEFGHETVSYVYQVGKNVKDFKVGDRVYPYPRYAKGDTKRAGTIGGFSEYILIPNAKLNHSLYFVPKEIEDQVAALIEPFTVGCRAARRGQPKKGEKALVFGCGTIGLASAMALKYFGVEKVMLVDVSKYRLDIALQMGFEVCFSEHLKEKANTYFGTSYNLTGVTYDVDLFIDAAGNKSILDTFLQEGKVGSRFVSVAVNNEKRKIDLLHMTYCQQSIIGSGGYMQEDVFDVLEIMKSHRFPIEKMITHMYCLDDLAKAIEKASQTDEALNVIIKMEK